MKRFRRNMKSAVLAFVFILSIFTAMPLSASALGVGDDFIAATVEAVDVTYVITKAADGVNPGTVQVGTGGYWESAISIFEVGTVTIPDTVTDGTDNYTVEKVAFNAFIDCADITKVILPNTVTTIADEAFYSCVSLQQVDLSNTLTSIGKDAFRDCNDLLTAVFPASLTSIGESAFAECWSLDNINIPADVTVINESTFENCNSLTNLTFSGDVTYIADGAFMDCASLTNVTLPDSLVTIGDAAFYGCASLTEMNLPDALTSIGNSAFEDCVSLTDFYMYKDTVPTIGPDTFTNAGPGYLIHVTSTTDVNTDPLWDYQDTTGHIIKDMFTATFHLNGGTLDSGDLVQIVHLNDLINTADLPVTSRNLYSFEGWYEDPAITILAAFPYTVIADVDFYARWDPSIPPSVTPAKLTINFSATGTIAVSLGVGKAGATSATITCDDPTVAAVAPANLLADGTVTVTSLGAVAPTTANIIVTWVGGPSNGLTETIPLTVRKKGNNGSKPSDPSTGEDEEAIIVNEVPVSYDKPNTHVTMNPSIVDMKEIELNGGENKQLFFNASTVSDVDELSIAVPANWFDQNGHSIWMKHISVGSLIISDTMFNDNAIQLSNEDVIFTISKGSLTVKIEQNDNPLDWNRFDNPLLISIPCTGNEYTVVYDANNQIVARSLYKNDSTVWAKIYKSGTYHAGTKSPSSFQDTEGGWMDAAVKFTTARGITNGVGYNRFDPDEKITRADFATMLVRMLGADASQAPKSSYKDYASIPDYAKDAVNFATSLGIIRGDDNGNFNPKANISRQDMFIMTYRAMEKFGILPSEITGDAVQFTDWNQVSDYAVSGMEALTKLKLVNGSDNKVTPHYASTRAEAAQFICNVVKFDMK